MKIISFGENIDGITLNENTDAISALKSLNKLYVLDLKNNPNLVWVEHVKELYTIKYLWLSGCTGMDTPSFVKLSKIINNWINGNYPDSYQLALIGTDTVNLALTDKTIKESVFRGYIPAYDSNNELISGLGNIENLQLVNINFTNESGTKLSATDANKLMNDVLGTFKTLKYLRIESKNTNYSTSDLSTIDFIGNNKVTELIELWLNRVNVKDLSNMNNYATQIKNLELFNFRNSEFSFSNMQTTLNNVYDNTMKKSESSKYNSSYCSLSFDKSTSSTFVNLSQVRGIFSRYSSTIYEEMDLTGFTSLTYIGGYQIFGGCKRLKLPASLVDYKISHPAIRWWYKY